MDEDKSGVISLVEFADYFAAEDNNKTRRMIKVSLFRPTNRVWLKTAKGKPCVFRVEIVEKSTLFHNKFQTNGTKGGLFDFGGFVVSTVATPALPIATV